MREPVARMWTRHAAVAAWQAASRASSLASKLQEKARLYSGPGSFFQRLSQQASTVAEAVTGNGAPVPAAAEERRPSTPPELRVEQDAED